MVCEHSWHFVELESEKENYVEKDICRIKIREKRHATFICDKCGLIKKIEIQ